MLNVSSGHSKKRQPSKPRSRSLREQPNKAVLFSDLADDRRGSVNRYRAWLNLFPARPSVNQPGAACRRRSPNSFSFLVV